MLQDTPWVTYGQDEFLQSKDFQILGGRVKLNWNENFDMDVEKFAECCSNLKETPLSHVSTAEEFIVGAEDDDIITMSKTFESENSSVETMHVKSGDVSQTGNQAKFTIQELEKILGTISGMQ